MIEVKKDVEGRWCSSCLKKENIFKVNIGFDSNFATSFFLCDTCLEELKIKLNKATLSKA